MDVPAASALEVAIADAGLLLVELEKFRAAGDAEGDALRAEVVALGHRARRLHRARTLDETVAAGLAGEAHGLVARARAALAALRTGPAYLAAVAAHRRTDHGALATLLPAVLRGLEFVPEPPVLFHAPTWLRRNRPRPAADVVADVVRVRDEGLVAEGDALAPGTDPDLPAVELLAGTPAAEPLLLRFDPDALPAAVFSLCATRQHLVHVPLLRTAFTVQVPDALDPDELGEISLDHARYRSQLLEALDRAGIGVRRA